MLFVPTGANAFGAVQETAGRPLTARGATVTPAIGSKGSWVEIFASLDEDTYGLLICINSNTASGASRNSVVDIGIGAAASELVIIPDLIAGNAGNYQDGGLWYYFPILIPAGTRVACRAQGTVTSTFRVDAQAFQSPINPAMLKYGGVVEAIGMTVPNGTAVTSGTTSDGAWTLLGTTVNRLWFWQVGVQVQSADISHVSGVYHIDLAEGDGTNYNVIVQSAIFTTSTAERGLMPPLTIGCDYPVPAGRDIYARAQFSGTPDPLYIAAYGAGG